MICKDVKRSRSRFDPIGEDEKRASGKREELNEKRVRPTDGGYENQFVNPGALPSLADPMISIYHKINKHLTKTNHDKPSLFPVKVLWASPSK